MTAKRCDALLYEMPVVTQNSSWGQRGNHRSLRITVLFYPGALSQGGRFRFLDLLLFSSDHCVEYFLM